jgi:hypothetical protein
VGEQLVSSQGVLVPIESTSNLNEISTVYNLRVADHHTYFVGGALWGWDVWVHNVYKAPKGAQQTLQELDIHEYGRFERLAKNSSDNLQGHELLGNNWLLKHGHITERGVGISRQNPAIALKTNGPDSLHQIVTRLQGESGHFVDKIILQQSWRRNVLDNISFLVEAGVDRNIIAKLARRTRSFAIKNGL